VLMPNFAAIHHGPSVQQHEGRLGAARSRLLRQGPSAMRSQADFSMQTSVDERLRSLTVRTMTTVAALIGESFREGPGRGLPRPWVSISKSDKLSQIAAEGPGVRRQHGEILGCGKLGSCR
jgi:hypothetical protein